MKKKILIILGLIVAIIVVVFGTAFILEEIEASKYPKYPTGLILEDEY